MITTVLCYVYQIIDETPDFREEKLLIDNQDLLKLISIANSQVLKYHHHYCVHED